MQTSCQLGCSPGASAVRASWEQLGSCGRTWWQAACWARAWKGFLWEVLCLVLVVQLSVGWKHCKKKALQGRSYSLLSPSVPVSSTSKSMAGACWYLGSSECASLLLWKTTETLALHQRSGRWLPHSHVQGLPSNTQKQFIVQAFFWGQ